MPQSEFPLASRYTPSPTDYRRRAEAPPDTVELQYDFDVLTAPLRLHRLFAHCYEKDEQRLPSSKKLIKDFEERFLLIDEDGIPGIKRLKGFKGQVQWKDAMLSFAVRSPDIPFFGSLASSWCEDVPIVYSSFSPESGATDYRCFYQGKEFPDEVPEWLRHRYEAMMQDHQGVRLEETTLDRFF